MIARRSLLLAAILISLVPAHSAQISSAILSHVGKASFWLNLPPGWTADQQAAKNVGAVIMLVPSGTTFSSAAVRLIGSSFKGTTVAAAMSRTKAKTLSLDPAAQIAELRSVNAGNVRMSLLEIRSKVRTFQPFETIAFVPLGQDVLVITLSGLTEEPYNRSKVTFTDMLKSYKEAGIEVQKGP
jgi:hypothetical protein